MSVLSAHAAQQISTIRTVEHVQMAVLALSVRIPFILDEFWSADQLEVVVIMGMCLLLLVILILISRYLLWLTNLLVTGRSPIESGS